MLTAWTRHLPWRRSHKVHRKSGRAKDFEEFIRSGTDDVGPPPDLPISYETRSEVGTTSSLDFFTGRRGRAEVLGIGLRSEAGVGGGSSQRCTSRRSRSTPIGDRRRRSPFVSVLKPAASRWAEGRGRASLAVPPKPQVDDQREQQADQDRGGDREGDGHVLALDHQISREAAQAKPLASPEHGADDDQRDPEHDEPASDLSHGTNDVAPTPTPQPSSRRGRPPRRGRAARPRCDEQPCTFFTGRAEGRKIWRNSPGRGTTGDAGPPSDLAIFPRKQG